MVKKAAQVGRYAVVVGERVDNLIVWDGVAEFDPGEGAELVLLEDDSPASFGWMWDGESFTPPEL